MLPEGSEQWVGIHRAIATARKYQSHAGPEIRLAVGRSVAQMAAEHGNDDIGPLEGKTAIVTDSRRGVGRDIDVALAREGAAVAVIGRTLEKCVKTLNDIEARGGRGVALGHALQASA